MQSGGCRRVTAEATLRLVRENSNDVRRVFLPAISDAIRSGRLEEKILEYNPNHGDQLQEEGASNTDPSTRSEGESNGGMSNILIAGIAIACFVGLVLAYLGFREFQDRRRRKQERSWAESSAYDNTLQDDSQLVQYSQQDGYHAESTSTSRPPIPPPPQLPDRSSVKKPRGSSQLAQVRQELEEYQYQPGLENSGPSLKDLGE